MGGKHVKEKEARISQRVSGNIITEVIYIYILKYFNIINSLPKIIQ